MSELRGKCLEMSTAAVEADPSLTLVRGWYHDPVWGTQEHWWTVRPDGSIYDPTAAQFPVPGVTALYEPFAGVFFCEECGKEMTEAEAAETSSGSAFPICSARCFGRMVGVSV